MFQIRWLIFGLAFTFGKLRRRRSRTQCPVSWENIGSHLHSGRVPPVSLLLGFFPVAEPLANSISFGPNSCDYYRVIHKVKHILNIASGASYVYILSGQKLITSAQNGPFWRVFDKPEACGQTVLPDRAVLIGQKLVKNAKIQKFKCDILSNFQTMCYS